MPLQNRVTPWGDIVAHSARGALMGNRGCLHDDRQRLGRARWRGKAWISCLLSFKGRRRTVMTPGRYTELFFTDEAVALAAGHRPCAECRRAAYLAFRSAFAAAFPEHGPTPRAGVMDGVLHAARTGQGARPVRAAAGLPEGAFGEDKTGAAILRHSGCWWRWSPGGYHAASIAPDVPLRLLTPEPILPVLAGGYRPLIDRSVMIG